MITLYYAPYFGSLAVHVIMQHLGLPVKLEKVAIHTGLPNNGMDPKISPLGTVPAIVDGNLALAEGVAVILYLLNNYTNDLLPNGKKERAKAIQWLMFCNASLLPYYDRPHQLRLLIEDDGGDIKKAEAAKILMPDAIKAINDRWIVIERQLENNTYLAGASLTAADILLAVVAEWNIYYNVYGVASLGPKTSALLKKVLNLPAFQKALEAEGRKNDFGLKFD